MKRFCILLLATMSLFGPIQTASADNICGRSIVYWAAEYGQYQNGYINLAYGQKRPAANEAEIQRRVAACLGVNPQDVHQIVNNGRTPNYFGEHCGQLVTYCDR